jgi:hypothetical protein
MWTLPVIIGLLISANLAALAQGGSRASKAKLDFVVTHCWGIPIEEAEIRIVQQGRESRLEYPKSRSIEVEPGTLQIIVRAQGYAKYSEVREVGRGVRLITPCLLLSMSEDGHDPPPFSVKGTVAQTLISDEPVWVRLVGMYSDFNSAALVDSTGSFLFNGVRAGRYYLMLFSNGKLKAAGEVSLRSFKERISVQPGSITTARD